jgi:hypothetical protein
MADFNNLVRDIHDYLAGNLANEDFSIDGSSARNVIDMAKGMATHTLDLLDHKPGIPKDPASRTVRMSELGEPCLRKLWYKWYHPELGLHPHAENGHPTLPIKFVYGDYIEELAVFLCKEAGHAVVWRQKQVEYASKRSACVAVGHIDCMIDGYVVDVKSAADVSFNKYKREGLTEDNDTFGYRYQLDAYAMAIGTTRRAFLFINKHDGEMLIIDRTHEVPVDMATKLVEIDDMMHEHTLGEQPRQRMLKEDPKGYGYKLDVVCGYCQFKYSCFDNIKGFIISGRPVYFIELTPKGTTYVADKTKIPPPPAYQKGEEVEIRGKGRGTIEEEEAPF